VDMPENVQGLYRHIVRGGRIRQLDNFNADVLHIFSRDILKRIKEGDQSWDSMVPTEIADVIRKRRFFGYKEAEELVSQA
jgi:hypothetical protein